MTQQSYGDGRRMSVAEAIGRRARMIRVHGSLANAYYRHQRHVVARDPWQDRRWADFSCHSTGHHDGREWVSEHVDQPEDVGLLDGIPVAMCAACRAARSEVET